MAESGPMSQTPPTPRGTARVLAALSLSLFCPAVCLPAQQDELLIVEKRKDLAGRASLMRFLEKRRVDVAFDKSGMDEVIRFLTAATGKKVNFFIGGKGIKAADLPELTLNGKSINLKNLMLLIQEKTGLRFTYHDGIVFLKPADQVKAFAYLRIYDVRAAVAMVRTPLPPKLGLRSPGEEPPIREEPEPQPINGYTLDGLVELIRDNAVKSSWDQEGISIDGMNGILLVRQTVAGHQAVRRILQQFGAIPADRVKRRAPARRKPLRPGKAR